VSSEDLLWAVRDAIGSDYEVLGEVARDAMSNVFLARARADQKLALLRLSRSQVGAGQDEFELDVLSTLDASVPDLESRCGRCGATLRPWARFCTKCGQDVSGVGPSSQEHLSRTGLLDAVREAAADEYEVIGDMPRAEGGGLVYFARERGSGRLVALRLQLEDGNEYSLGVTRVLRPVEKTAPKPVQRKPAITIKQAAVRPPAGPPAPRPPARAVLPHHVAEPARKPRWPLIVGALALIGAAIAAFALT
jgi:hypothetical protein